MQLYEYIVWADEKRDKQTDAVTRKAEVIVPHTTVIAKDEEVAKIMATKAIPAEWDDKLDEVNVSIRPF